MNTRRCRLAILALLVVILHLGSGQKYDVRPFRASREGIVQGPRLRWHRITIGFRGPSTHEKAKKNPFLNYRLVVTFIHPRTGRKYVVPGYYAADGNSANTGAASGNVWLVHFAPDLVGQWRWSASFRRGHNVAVRGKWPGRSAGFFDRQSGAFFVKETDKTESRDFRAKGRLAYVGRNHLKFANGDWFLKGGADSPENLLAYQDFDNTPNEKGRRKTYRPHLRDYRKGDITWRGGKGKGLLGALNYLSLDKGMNAFSFLTMNIAGDDRNVFPYVSNTSFLRIDVSKMAQWEVVFSHAEKRGLFMHFKTQETENDQLLDGGDLGTTRKLYYRELIARFSHHLALNWNIGEENTNTRTQRLSFSQYFKDHDPYKHPVVIHSKPDDRSMGRIFGGVLGEKSYDGISIQASQVKVFELTRTWRRKSNQALHPWVVSNDEQAGAGMGIVPDGENVDPNHDQARANVLWGNLLAGGAGVEYYFGYRYPQSDMTLQDFRSRDQFWDQTRHALRFFQNNKIPFWRMVSISEPSFNGVRCLADEKRNTMVMYLPKTTTTNRLPRVSVRGGPNSLFSVRWYNPRTGGALQKGTVQKIAFGRNRRIGHPPGGPSNKDWVVLIRRVRGTPHQLTRARSL